MARAQIENNHSASARAASSVSNDYADHRNRNAIRWSARLLAVTTLGVGSLAMMHGQVIHIADARTQYIQGTPRDAITSLQAKINSGSVKLKFDAQFGYLPSLLHALNLSTTSQVVVFSKTSVQKEFISPETPRSLYFNDSTYVGYVRDAKALEICTSEPYLGAVYYTLLQREVPKPRFFRTVDACLECHADKSFSHLPQHFMYSTHCASDGTPTAGEPPVETTDGMPLGQRFGGWYVTGTAPNNLGNNSSRVQDSNGTTSNQHAVRVISLTQVIDSTQLLTPYSDIVALMTFGHQQRLLNLIADATYQTNSALALDKLYPRRNSISGSSATETTEQTIRRVCEPVVDGLLFVGEAQLASSIQGGSGFAQYFESVGPKDRAGRSLRDFDLKHRLFRYPCSYLIYSSSFSALPDPARRYVYRRIWDVLLGKEKDHRFAGITGADRRAIREILLATKPEFAAYGPRN